MAELRWGAATDPGRVRKANEDGVLAAPGVFAVADGMGGHAAGEIASRLATEYVKKGMLTAAMETCKEALQRDPKYTDARLMLAGLNELVTAIQLGVRERLGAQEIAVVSGIIKEAYRKLGVG